MISAIAATMIIGSCFETASYSDAPSSRIFLRDSKKLTPTVFRANSTLWLTKPAPVKAFMIRSLLSRAYNPKRIPNAIKSGA